MNIELIRLGTFVSWPHDAPVSARELSQCGFFVTNNSILQAECAWCHCRISDWEDGDTVWLKHRNASPQCKFIVDYKNSDNVPLPQILDGVTSDCSGNRNHPHPSNSGRFSSDILNPSDKSLYVEENRLATFKNWPNPNVTPESLAKVGFYYLNFSDQVKCVWCEGIVAQWEENDDPFEEHKKFFPKCPRTQLGPLIEIGPEGIESLGIQNLSVPKNPKYVTLHSRLATFANWPIPELQKPENLAEAGLFSEQFRDLVRCFHCNIGLRCWEKFDDPWFEHARWSPKCSFVRIMKGNSFITEVQNTMKILTPQRILENAMASSPVHQALQLSIEYDVIREHMCKHMQRTGLAFSSIEELLQSIFDSEEDDDENNYDDCKDNHNEETSTIGLNNLHLLSSEGGNLTPEGAAALPLNQQSQTIVRNTISGNPQAEEGKYEIMVRLRKINVKGLMKKAKGAAAVSDSLSASTSGCVSTTSTSTSMSDFRSSFVNASVPRPTPTSIGESESTTMLASTTAVTSESSTSLEELPSSEALPALTKEALLEEENRKLKDELLCKICFDEVVNVVYLPCGHLVTCVQCASGVGQCPMCRSEIKGYVRTYLS